MKTNRMYKSANQQISTSAHQRISSSAHQPDSAVVTSFHYDRDEETLTIRFKSGTVYEYYDVPQSTYNAFIQAESLGAYLNNEIKGVYAYIRIK